MSFENYFPLWNDLNTAQKKLISDNLITQHVKKGTIIHNGNMDCTGLLLVKSGQLRTYILSDEGREITLYIAQPGLWERGQHRHIRAARFQNSQHTGYQVAIPTAG